MNKSNFSRFVIPLTYVRCYWIKYLPSSSFFFFFNVMLNCFSFPFALHLTAFFPLILFYYFSLQFCFHLRSYDIYYKVVYTSTSHSSFPFASSLLKCLVIFNNKLIFKLLQICIVMDGLHAVSLLRINKNTKYDTHPATEQYTALS